MRNPFDTEEFRILRRTWDMRLKQEGFKDAEDTNRPDQPLKTWNNFKRVNVTQEQFIATQEYFVRARDLIETYAFENVTQRRIWELHCEGISKRKIEKLIAHYEKPYKREQIGNIIKLIAAEIL